MKVGEYDQLKLKKDLVARCDYCYYYYYQIIMADEAKRLVDEIDSLATKETVKVKLETLGKVFLTYLLFFTFNFVCFI